MEKIPKFGIVGNAPEIKKIEVLAKIQDKFIKQNFASKKEINKLKEAEIEKTPEQESIIDFINSETNRLMIEAGVEPFIVPIKNIHIVKDEYFKNEINNDGGEAAMDHIKQAIFIMDSVAHSNIKFSSKLFHEMLHMKSKQVLEVSYDLEKEKGKIGPYRSGVKVFSTHAKDSLGPEHVHFTGLNEAIVANQEIKSYRTLLELPENANDKSNYYSTAKMNKRIEYAKKHHISEDEIEDINTGDRSFSVFPYETQRKVLDYVCEEIAKQYPEKFIDNDSVFKVFLKAHFTGHLLEIGHLIENTFGKGSLRVLGIMDYNPDSSVAANILEKLQKDRRNFELKNK